MSEQDFSTPPDFARHGARPGLARRLWSGKWLRLFALLGAIAAVAAPFAVDWLAYRFAHSITDDAFVETHVVNIGPQQVSGPIVRMLVQEHDTVVAGQVLVERDAVPYCERVDVL